MEGLNLTPDNIEEPMEDKQLRHGERVENISGPDIANISAINDVIKDSYIISELNQGSQFQNLCNLQQQFDNIEQVEAELEAEVNQLDQLY